MVSARGLRPQLLHHVLALEVLDLDGGAAGGGAEQVPRQRSGQGKAGFEWMHLLGLKVRALMVLAWSRVYRCFPSFRSHSMSFTSLPTEAKREPSGRGPENIFCP